MGDRAADLSGRKDGRLGAGAPPATRSGRGGRGSRPSSRGLSATSRDPEDWAAATEAARAARAAAAEEVSLTIATQVRELVVEGDVMASRGTAAERITQIVVAEKTGDRVLERAAWIDLAVAAATNVARLDYVPPKVPERDEDEDGAPG
jgi:hypothetical protein